MILSILLGIGLVILLSVHLYSIDKVKKDLEEKMNLFITKKEKELEGSINAIKSWERYINFSIGDPVLIKIDLVNTKDGESDINYTAFIEAKIVDLTKNRAKLEFIDATTNKNNARITKTGISNYLIREPWHNLDNIERRLTLEDRREMQLNKLIK